MSTRDRSILAAVVLIIIAVGGYFLVVQPQHHKANELKAQIGSEQSDLSQAESQVQAGLTAEGEYKTYARQLTSISAAVPNDQQIPQIINELQAASTKNQVGFQEVSVSTSSAAPVTTTGTTATTFPSQSFSLSFSGSYFSVADLLGTLASYVHADDKHFKATGRLISISSVSLAPGASSGTSTITKPGAVTASVTALDYDVPTTLLSGTSATTTGTTP